jgi:citrate lyase beta subunit
MIKSWLFTPATRSGCFALVDSLCFHIADTDGRCRYAKRAIHPSQISVMNAVPMPSAKEIDQARKIVALNAQGAASLSIASDTAERQVWIRQSCASHGWFWNARGL